MNLKILVKNHWLKDETIKENTLTSLSGFFFHVTPLFVEDFRRFLETQDLCTLFPNEKEEEDYILLPTVNG